MAVLSSGDRAALVALFGDDLSKVRTLLGLSRSDLRAAVDAIDQWAEDNAAAFNSAIPQPARGVLTTKQKAWLLKEVLRRRYEVA